MGLGLWILKEYRRGAGHYQCHAHGVVDDSIHLLLTLAGTCNWRMEVVCERMRSLLLLLLLLLTADEFIPSGSVLQCKTIQYYTIQYK